MQKCTQTPSMASNTPASVDHREGRRCATAEHTVHSMRCPRMVTLGDNPECEAVSDAQDACVDASTTRSTGLSATTNRSELGAARRAAAPRPHAPCPESVHEALPSLTLNSSMHDVVGDATRAMEHQPSQCAPQCPHHDEFGDARCAADTRLRARCVLGAAETLPVLALTTIKQWRVAVGNRAKGESTIHNGHRNIRTTLSLATQDAPPTHNLAHRSYSALPQRRDYWRKTR